VDPFAEIGVALRIM